MSEYSFCPFSNFLLFKFPSITSLSPLSINSLHIIRLVDNTKETSDFFVFQILVVPTKTLRTASYSPLETKMDWNPSSFTSKKPNMPCMETVAMDPHSVEAMIFTSPTVQAPTPTLELIWATVTRRWRGTNTVQAIHEAYLPEAPAFSHTRSKCFIRLTKTDIVWLIWL